MRIQDPRIGADDWLKEIMKILEYGLSRAPEWFKNAKDNNIEFLHDKYMLSNDNGKCIFSIEDYIPRILLGAWSGRYGGWRSFSCLFMGESQLNTFKNFFDNELMPAYQNSVHVDDLFVP